MDKKRPSICAVIVNYNGAKYQNDCMKSLYDMNYENLRILVVDSASKDNSLDLLREEYTDVEIITCDTNVGIAKGNNIGIEYSLNEKFDYTLLLNNDTEVDKNLLNYMIDEADENTVVVPKIYYYEPHNNIWFAGGRLVWEKGSTEHFGIHEEDKGQFQHKKYINYAPTCCMLINNIIFERVGLIDEDYFMYFDDADLCARFEKAKVRICYEPRAYMWHKVSSSSGGENSKIQVYYSYRNQLRYLAKHADRVRLRTKIYVYCRAFVKYVLGCLKKNNDRIILKAYLDYFRGNMGRCDSL